MQELSYTSLPTPVGTLWLAASEPGLCRVSMGSPDENHFLEEMSQRRPGMRLVRKGARLGSVLRQLEEYFDRRRRVFDLETDLDGLTPFQRDVLRVTGLIPHGSVSSYGDIARRLGRPGAARAVGAALGSNPVPIIIPCHRVLASDGRIGGFSVGSDSRATGLKRRLLSLEGATLPL